MTPQLSAFVAAGRASELATAARHAHRDVVEPAQKPAARRAGWLARLALPACGSRSAPSISSDSIGCEHRRDAPTVGVKHRPLGF